MNPKTVLISLRLPADVNKRLEELAVKTHRPKSFYLRELIVTGIDRLEWEYSVAQRRDDIRTGKQETVTLEAVEEELGLSEEAIDYGILDGRGGSGR